VDEGAVEGARLRDRACLDADSAGSAFDGTEVLLAPRAESKAPNRNLAKGLGLIGFVFNTLNRRPSFQELSA